MFEIFFLSTITAVFGAIIGSFLGMCVYRLPIGRYEEEEDQNTEEIQTPVSICNPPRSFCPTCKKQLAWWQNIPIVSWILLGGKCFYCKEKISVKYPLIELLTLISAILSLFKFGPTLSAFFCFAFLSSLIVITFIDLKYMIIPNLISFPGVAIGLIIGCVQQFFSFDGRLILAPPFVDSILSSFLGLMFGGGFLFIIAEAYLRLRKKDGLGLGDVKLLAMIGACFGPECALFTIFSSSLIALAIMLPLVATSKHGFQQHLPFGPFIALGSVLYIFDVPALLGIFHKDLMSVFWWISIYT